MTLSHLAVIVVAMGLSGLLLLSLLDRYFMEAMEASLVTQAQITAQALIPGATMIELVAETEPAASNTLRQQQLLNYRIETQNAVPPAVSVPASGLDLGYLTDASLELSAQLDTRIRVLDVDGVVLVDSAQASQGENLKDDPLVAQALQGQYASHTDEAGSRDAPAMHIALPVMVEDRLAGVIYLSQSLQDVTAVLHDMRSRWWLSMG
ncbi:MAG: hypothetical protein JXA89_14630, partial [Anaerolineae bacterium]|nr:hypothetical protein [Anaerolineae bacterium]